MKGKLAMVLASCLGFILHLRALKSVPIEQVDFGGAEYIPHLQRVLATALFPLDLTPPWGPLVQLDGHYGGLLHILAAIWAFLGPEASSPHALVWATHLSFLALVITAFSVFALIQTQTKHEFSAAIGGAFTLFLPGLLGPAQRYYYDLPMTAALLLSAAFLLGSGGRVAQLLGGVCAGIALLFKWSAALYLAPIACLYVLSLRKKGDWAKSIALPLGIAILVTLPLLLNRGGSFDFQVSKVMGAPPQASAEAVSTLSQVSHYLGALMVDGVGSVIFFPLVAATAIGIWKNGDIATGGLILIVGPLAALVLLLKEPDSRYLLPILPWIAVLLGRSLAELSRSKAALIALILMAVGMQTIDDYGLVSAPPKSEKEINFRALSPERHWWYSGYNNAKASPLLADKEMAQTILKSCQGTRLLLKRSIPHNLPAHPLRFWMEALQSNVEIQVMPPGNQPQKKPWPEAVCVLSTRPLKTGTFRGSPVPIAGRNNRRLYLYTPGASP